MFDWNDIRLFLAVAGNGSTRAVAAELGLNQTTVARRLVVLEHDLKLVLFDRSTRGHSLTEDGKVLAKAAEPMLAIAQTVRQTAESRGRALSGAIRISAAEIVFNQLVTPVVAEFRASHPDVRIEFDSSEGFVDLLHGGADIVFRATSGDIDGRLFGARLADVAWSAFCSREYAAQHGMPRSLAEVRDHPVVAFVGAMGERKNDQWFMTHVDPGKIAGVSNTVMNLTGILRAGIGIGTLPCHHAEAQGDLVRCFPPPKEMYSALWLLTTPEKRQVPRIAAFMDLSVRRFRALRWMLRGDMPRA